MNRSSRLRPRPAAMVLICATLAAGCGSTSGKGTTAASSPSAPAATSAPASDNPTAATSTSSPVPPASSDPALSGTLTVFAAASLTGSFRTLGTQFEAAHPGVHVRFDFAASSALAAQIIQGAPADVFASASPKNMAQVTKAKDAADPTTFARNTAEIAVAPSAAGQVTSVADLARPGVKVALCQPQVPCGVLARTVLAKAKVSVRPVTLGLDVKSTLAYVTSGAADAAVVYVTDVKAAGAKVRPVVIPAADNASTAYPIATVTASRHAALAAAFVAYVESASGQGVLRRAGFSGP